MLQESAKVALKTLAVWIALLIGQVAGFAMGNLAGGNIPPAPPGDGPLSSGSALLLVSLLTALILGALASWARIRGLRLALFLFVVLFGTQTVMAQIETVFFNEYVRIPLSLLSRLVIGAAISAAAGATMAALLFKPSPRMPDRIGDLARRLPLVALAYVALYFAAGHWIAWQSADLRAYYAEGQGIPQLALIALQVVRGTMWAILAWLIVRNLTGTILTRAVLTMSAFSVFGAAQLLYPNPYMPWSVRLPHLVEVGLSHALFGAIAAVLLLARPTAGAVMRKDANP